MPNSATSPLLRRKEENALETVARRYYGPLRRFFLSRTSNSAEAEDLVQQVFLGLSGRPQAAPIVNPEGFIFQAAANALKNHYRRHQRAQSLIGPMDDMDEALASELSPQRVIEGQEAVAQLVGVLERLPERTRDIFYLRFIDGLKHEEIARQQGISVRAVEKHCAKALVKVSLLADGIDRG